MTNPLIPFNFYEMDRRLILASESPRRCELLKQMGLPFEVIPSRIQEDVIRGETPEEHVLRLCGEKALEVGKQYRDRWVTAADTIVTIEGAILGKPGDRDEAMEMLGRLSGKEHRVLTGFSVCHLEKGLEERSAVETAVTMKLLSEEEMRWYVETGEPFDKAGAYAIQGIGSCMIESIRGSYTNVVGLPLCELLRVLIRLGAITISELGIRIAK